MGDRFKSFLRTMISVDLSPLWGTVRKNWIVKLSCLVLAFAVWQVIRESTRFEVVVPDIPLVIRTGAGVAVLDQSTDVVSVRFRGSRDDIRFISRDQVSVEVDLTKPSDSLRHHIKMTRRYVKAPSQARAVHFVPEDLVITLDREVERVLPVKAALSGQLPDGIKLEQVVCDPASIRVRGAEQHLLDLEQVRTLPIRLDGRYNSFGTHAAIAAEDQLWTASPDRVMVNVDLIEQAGSREIEQAVVRVLRAATDSQTLMATPERVNVTLKGSADRIEALDIQDVVVYVDCVGLSASTDYEVQVRVDVPRGIQVERVVPSVVKVSVNSR